MIPRFLAHGSQTPPLSLVVDGDLHGDRVYSHWKTAPPTPWELVGDTSTEILLNAAADPVRWFDDSTCVCNDHIDADGLLSMLVALQPTAALVHRRLLIDAAEAGDFSAWTGERPFRLMLVLHQLIRDERLRGPGWEQRCCDAMQRPVDAWVADSGAPNDERDAQVAQVLLVRKRLEQRAGFTLTKQADLLVIEWHREHGHADDSFLAVHQRDDLPMWALDGLAAPSSFHLLVERTESGSIYRLLAPGHSWARTVRRPLVPWPDLEAVAEHLRTIESGQCRWCTGDAARRIGFVCLLVSTDEHGQASASATPSAVVVDVVRTAMTARGVPPGSIAGAV